MKMRRAAFDMVGVLFLCLMFVSCRWECGGMSENDLPWFVPVDYIARTVLFTNGKDTVAIEYDSPEISHAMDKTFATVRGCSTTVSQYGVGDVWRVEYEMQQVYIKGREATGYHYLVVVIHFDDREYRRLLTRVTQTLITSGKGSRLKNEYEKDWESISGDSYRNVLKAWGVDQSDSWEQLDTFYLSAGKGLVQMDFVSKGETWWLIRPEDEAGAE